MDRSVKFHCGQISLWYFAKIPHFMRILRIIICIFVDKKVSLMSHAISAHVVTM